MRIQISEMMPTSDAEMVLRALEWSFRDVSVEVVRDGSRITVRGLGPSQRTMNRNDIAVVEVVCEDHRTVIRADITYQASALLGGISQDELVRSKLERVLDRVKLELGTERARVEDVPWLADPVSELEAGVEPEPVMVPDPAFQQEHAVEVEHGGEPETSGNSEHLVEIEPPRREEPIVESELIREPEPEAPVVVPVVPETVVPVEAAIEKSTTSSASSSRVEIPMFQTFHPEDTKTPKRWGTPGDGGVHAGGSRYLCGLAVSCGVGPRTAQFVVDCGRRALSGTQTEATKLSADKVPMHEPVDANTLVTQNVRRFITKANPKDLAHGKLGRRDAGTGCRGAGCVLC